MPNLTCKQCDFVNESERVYCHNCGAKLDRSVLPANEEVKESRDDTLKRVKKMVNPSSRTLSRTIRTFLNTIAWAALVAALIEAARPPAGTPPMPEKRPVESQSIDMIMEEVENGPVSRPITMTADDINPYLLNALKAKPADYLGDYIQFSRLFVTLGDGTCTINIEESVFGWPIYMGSTYRLSIQNRVIEATNVGGNIGHIPIDPRLMAYGKKAFGGIFTALNHQHTLMNGAHSVQILKGDEKTPPRMVVVAGGR